MATSGRTLAEGMEREGAAQDRAGGGESGPPRAGRQGRDDRRRQNPGGESAGGHAGPKASSACPDCGERAVTEGCEVVCPNCGLVVSEYRVRHGPEWRYDEDTPAGEGRRRCNGRPERASDNPGWARTRIGTRRERRRATSRGIGFHRMATLHTRASDYETEVLNHAIPEIKRLCSRLDVRGDTVERACGIFRRARSAGFLSRRRIETVAGAAVYVACREHRVPHLPSDVAAVLRLSEDDLCGSTVPVDAMLRAFRGLCRADEVHVEPYPLTPLDYVPRVASRLGAPPATRLRSRAIARAAIEAGAVADRAPGCVAGASLDLAIAESDRVEASHVDVADAAGYTVETLRDVRQAIEGSLAVDAIDGGCALSG